MQFRSIFALLSLAAVASASAVARAPAQPKPSSTPPSYTCPETNSVGKGKVTELCDSPPHSGTLFGCTYNTGHGTGTHACTYKTGSGECTTKDSRCPSTATSQKKRDAHARRESHTF